MFPRPFTSLRPVACFAGVVLTACGAAPKPVDAPTIPTDKQTRCAVTKSQARPLIVEWPSADRATLEARIRDGVVAVRYAGCEMEVLGRCSLAGEYAYAALTKQHESFAVRDVDDLWAKLPLGAASLEGTLESEGELNLAMTMVGRYEWRGTPRFADLQGTCEGATHIISGLIVGAFDFSSGTDSSASAGGQVAGFGSGAHTRSTRRTLNQAGDESACDKATTKDAEPPNGCGAMLRVEVIPIADAPALRPPEPAEAPADSEVASPSRPAPAAPRPGRLIVSGGTVHDTQTGLVWQRSSASAMNYWDAKKFCGRLELSRHDAPIRSPLLAQEAAPSSREEWRLPTGSELRKFASADPSMRGVYWASDAEDYGWLRPRTRPQWGNLLGQSAMSFFVVEMPQGSVREVSSGSERHQVRCVK